MKGGTRHPRHVRRCRGRRDAARRRTRRTTPPRHEYEIAAYHLGLFDLHAAEEGTVDCHNDDGSRELVPLATWAHCDNGNLYESI
ncbi:hypothetical protein [Nonomuraea rhizosphaerae]|uniref:hypothetical protein n=1 Tax=Nonomuraea rhizosphaerae TaxID=2665663 RepID=UPI001C5EA4C0|nr:hypothetical protein [Nonomuraea rhizosphaerae]